MFLVTSPDHIPPTSAFKVSADNFEETINRIGFSKHSYLGRHNWIHLDDISRLTRNEWKQFIVQSYQLVADKLPNKIKNQIEL
ncbi:MAG: hypothetical protein WKG06_29390 [Segetibacter sp.]